MKDIHPTHTNKSFHGSSERLLTITFRMWCWLGLTGDGGLYNHVSHNTWIHVWSNSSKSRGRERGRRLGLLERKRERERERERKSERRLGLLGGKFFYLQCLFWTGSVRSGLTGSCITKPKTENRTEPRFFLTILIGLIGFFFGSVFSVNFFSVFSVYSVFWFFCTPLIGGKKRESDWCFWTFILYSVWFCRFSTNLRGF